MIKLRIEHKNNYKYNLKDENENEYIINLEFFSLDKQPEKGDYIYINKELLNPKYEGYSTSYTFGNIDSKYGKKDISIEDIDIIKIIINNTEKYLKRLYG